MDFEAAYPTELLTSRATTTGLIQQLARLHQDRTLLARVRPNSVRSSSDCITRPAQDLLPSLQADWRGRWSS